VPELVQDARDLVPLVAGETRAFTTSNGRSWSCKKVRRGEYLLVETGPGASSRSRWGDEGQITSDLRHVVAHGEFPPAPRTSWY
jgi:hypothetical protein